MFKGRRHGADLMLFLSITLDFIAISSYTGGAQFRGFAESSKTWKKKSKGKEVIVRRQD
jgi:hypoxanthine-guanine phosphoribosyltransferase